MSSSRINLPPLPADVTALLETEKARPAPGPEALEQVLRGLATTGLMPPDDGGAGGGAAAPAGDGHGDAVGHESGSVAPVPDSGAGAMWTLLRPLSLVPLSLGIILGAGAYHLMAQWAAIETEEHLPRDISVQPVLPTQAVAPLEAVPMVPAVPLPEAGAPDLEDHPRKALDPSPRKPKVRNRAKRQPSPPSARDAERELLEVARTALGRGRGAEALAALERHRKRFPRGDLLEERQALQIIAMVAVGDAAKAHAWAARFRKRYPKSLLLPAISEALERLTR